MIFANINNKHVTILCHFDSSHVYIDISPFYMHEIDE